VSSKNWDAIYQAKVNKPLAAFVLEQNKHLLPKQGAALDLACGQGGNALLLAKAGLTVSAWDTSQVAITQLIESAKASNLIVDAQLRDVVIAPPEGECFDVIVVSHFLDRALCPLLMHALRPGGLLFYQTYCEHKVEQQGPKSPQYLLKNNELLALFSPMSVRVYREEALLGERTLGWRNQALLVAEK